MKYLILKQTSIVIPDYELGDCEQLESYFTLFDRVNFQSYFYGVIYNEEKKELIIPRGVDISLVERITGRKAKVYNNADPVDHISPYNMKLLPKNKDQTSAIKFLAGLDEFKYTDNVSQLALNLDTGVGKTYCSVAYLGLISCRGLVITSAATVITQWIDRLKYYTDIKQEEILILNSSQICIRITNHNYDISKFKIILATHGTIRSFATTYGWEMVGELFKKLRIGVKFYDECHKDFSNMYYIDYYTNTYKTIYISATLNRSDHNEDFVYQLYMKNVPYINLFNPENNHTKYLALFFNSNPTHIQRNEIVDRRFGLNRPRYVEYLVNTEEYEKMLILLFTDYIFKLGYNEKCLIYIGTNEAILKTFDLIYKNFPTIIDDVGIFTSLFSNNEKYKNLDKKIILTTTKSAGEAIDIANLKMTILLAEPFKSKLIAKQSLGRTRDNDTIYIEVVDRSFKKLIDFYNLKKSVFKMYSTECIEQEISKPYLANIYNDTTEFFTYKSQEEYYNNIKSRKDISD